MLAQAVTQQLRHAGDQPVDVDRLGVERLAPGESQQALSQRSRALRPAHRIVGGVTQARARVWRVEVGRVALNCLQVAQDNGQQIVEIVGDAAGELADRFHLLRLLQALIECLRVGDVTPDSGDDAFARHCRPHDPAMGAVAMAHAVLEADGIRCQAQRCHDRFGGGPIVGMDQLKQVAVEEFALLPTEHGGPGGVEGEAGRIQPHHHHQVARQSPDAVPLAGALGHPRLQRQVDLAQGLHRFAAQAGMARLVPTRASNSRAENGLVR